MKMEALGKAEHLVHSEVPPKTSEKQDTTPNEDRPIELERKTQKDNVPTAADSVVFSSMPCLLMELRRDSSEFQLASTESDKPVDGRVYESDSSNHCMLSPSSSGHLADSDTLSSTEENEPCQAEAAVEGDPSVMSGAVVGRKSRRSRSESETSTMAAKKNRQSSDKQNGRITKVKGHRSQKHKERIRLLRQKREAAARKKYNLLQDSSTSDSDLTCASSTSSSDDDEEVSGSSKTITTEIPGGPLVVTHYDISDTNSDPEVVNVDNLSAAAVVQEHNNSVGNQDSGCTWRTRGLLDELGANAGHLNPGFLASDKTSFGNAQVNEKINIASSDSEVEIVGVQEHDRKEKC
ncbi:protein ARK2N-like isoform X2 [Phaenicophaeus curvirostris]|uniref:protein ARK2N-like isoform X2 n=1 Tax=Phaenicophaeus curvirostris TaxID=33595 RepID=UPI0037F09944